ncbi:hypothetical protein ACFX14_003272 [Malus domestica]
MEPESWKKTHCLLQQPLHRQCSIFLTNIFSGHGSELLLCWDWIAKLVTSIPRQCSSSSTVALARRQSQNGIVSVVIWRRDGGAWAERRRRKVVGDLAVVDTDEGL